MSIIGKIVELVTTETGVLDKSIEMLDKAEEKLQTKSEKNKQKLFECPVGERALLLNQAQFTWREQFSVYDGYEKVKYVVKGEFTSIKRHFHIYDIQGHEVGYVKEKLMTFRPSAILESDPIDFTFEIPGQKPIHMKSKWAVIRGKFKVDNGWYVEGNLSGWKYKIFDSQEKVIANVQYKPLYWGDTYLITFPENANDLLILMIVLSIDIAHAPKKKEDFKNTLHYQSHYWL